MLEIEDNTFILNLNKLIQTNIGKFVLIKEDKIIGVYESSIDALKIGYEKFKQDSFFVKQILPLQQPLNFANNFQLL